MQYEDLLSYSSVRIEALICGVGGVGWCWEVLGAAGMGGSCAVVESDGRWNEGAAQVL